MENNSKSSYELFNAFRYIVCIEINLKNNRNIATIKMRKGKENKVQKHGDNKCVSLVG